VTLDPGESTFYSFTEAAAASVTVTLASVVQPGRAAALSTPMTLGMGTPAGEGCTVTDSLQATPALAPQLTVTLAAGVHCISVGHPGQFPSTVIAAVRFTHQ
jgi:ABC-type spermidine/putrescine transport system permease subunit II